MFMSKVFEENLKIYQDNPNIATRMLHESHRDKIALLDGLTTVIQQRWNRDVHF